MDGSVAIEENRQALKRIVAMLVDMAGLADGDRQAAVGDRQSKMRGGVGARGNAARQSPGCRLPTAATMPRLLWRAILALLRPAESAARRLIIAASRGLTVPPPRPRKGPKPATMEPLLRKLGIAVMVAPGDRAPIHPRSRVRGTTRSVVEGARSGVGAAEPLKPRTPTFPLFDPPRRINLHGHRQSVPPHAAPRIFVPGLTGPAPLPPPPSPDEWVGAERLTRRLAALAAALDDLSGQAKRFARWKARLDDRHAREPKTPRRLSPIRRTRPPGGRLFRYDPNVAHPSNIREVDEILAHAHDLALHALDYPDTS